MKGIEQQICDAVKAGSLEEPFNAAMIRAACPGWADRDYHIVLSDHTVGSGCSNELFERVSFGLYRIVRPPAGEESRASGSDAQGPVKVTGETAAPIGVERSNGGVALVDSSDEYDS